MWSTNSEACNCTSVTQHANVRLCARAYVGVGGCVLAARKKNRSDDESHQSSHTAQFVTQLIGHSVVFTCGTRRWRHVVSRSLLSRWDSDTRFQSFYKLHKNAWATSKKKMRLTRRLCSLWRRGIFDIIFLWGWLSLKGIEESRLMRGQVKKAGAMITLRWTFPCVVTSLSKKLYTDVAVPQIFTSTWQIFSKLMCS
jgi:hypothetical protein